MRMHNDSACNGYNQIGKRRRTGIASGGEAVLGFGLLRTAKVASLWITFVLKNFFLQGKPSVKTERTSYLTKINNLIKDRPPIQLAFRDIYLLFATSTSRLHSMAGTPNFSRIHSISTLAPALTTLALSSERIISGFTCLVRCLALFVQTKFPFLLSSPTLHVQSCCCLSPVVSPYGITTNYAR
jgi:hypothetical protein